MEDHRSSPHAAPIQDAARRYRWLALSCAGLGMYLVGLDISVNVALPSITSHFHSDIRTIQWIIVSFVVTRAGLAVVAGSLGDLVGLARVFLVGVMCYTVAITVIAFSPSLAPVIGLRVLQGVGAGALYAVAPAIAGRAYSPGQRGMAMGVTTAGFALGTLAGTLGAGLLVEAMGWDWAFLGRLPFCVVAMLLGLLALKGEAGRSGSRSFDIVGSASLVAAMVVLVLALHLGGRIGWSSPQVVGLLIATPLLAATFLRSELTARWPILDLRLFRLPAFSSAFSGTFLVHLGAFVIWFAFPFYVADALNRGALFLGAMLAVMAAAMFLAAPIGGWLSDRVHPKYVGLAGTVATALGLLWMSQLDGSASVLSIGTRIALVGIGLGLFQAAAYSLALKFLPAGQFGMASGSLSLSQALGSVISVAVAGLVFSERTEAHTLALAQQGFGADEVGVQAMVLSFQDTFLLGAAFAAVGVVVLLATSLSNGRNSVSPDRSS